MSSTMILASGSDIRRTLLRNAGLHFDVVPARVDEGAVRESMLADGAPPRDIADALAELKAQKISAKHPEALVIGCDQVLSFDGTILGKPENPEAAEDQIRALRARLEAAS